MDEEKTKNESGLPINEVSLDNKNFRQYLQMYQEDEIEKYIIENDKNTDDFVFRNRLNLMITYITEKRGNLSVNGNKRSFLGQFIRNGTLNVNGDVDEYIGRQMSGGKIIVNGNAGDYAGGEIEGGEVIIKENAGGSTGDSMSGGIILIEKDSGIYTGNQMEDGMIIVYGNIGATTGFLMKGGTIICLGKVEEVVEYMEGGMIYANEFGEVRGKSKSFVKTLDMLFNEDYEKLPEYLRISLENEIRRTPEKFYRNANNRKIKELLANILDKDPDKVALEYERAMKGMW